MQQSPAQLLPSGKKQNSNGQQVQQQQSGTGLTSKPMDMKTPMPMDSAQRNREWLARGAATSGSGPAGKVSDGDAQHLLDGNGTVEGAEESLSSSGKKGGRACAVTG